MRLLVVADHGDRIVRFADIDFRRIDRTRKRRRRLLAPRSGRRQAHHTKSRNMSRGEHGGPSEPIGKTVEYDGRAPERRLPDGVLALVRPYLAEAPNGNSAKVTV